MIFVLAAVGALLGTASAVRTYNSNAPATTSTKNALPRVGNQARSFRRAYQSKIGLFAESFWSMLPSHEVDVWYSLQIASGLVNQSVFQIGGTGVNVGGSAGTGVSVGGAVGCGGEVGWAGAWVAGTSVGG